MTTRINLPAGDLARVISSEASEEWPSLIEIVAYWGTGDTGGSSGVRRGKRRSVKIPADQFFGRGYYGAPMTGDQLIGMIDRLRRGIT